MTLLSDISNEWSYWAVFVLWLIFMLICAIQPNSVYNSLRMFSSPIQRQYEDQASSVLSHVLQYVFRWGVMALTICNAVKGACGVERFTLTQYGWVVLILLGTIAIKNAIDWYIQTTFQFQTHYPTMRQHRNNIWQVICWILFLYLLIEPWLNDTARWIIPCVLLCAYILVWGWKILLAFGLTLKHVCFIVLYLLHTEILALLFFCGSTYTILNEIEHTI